MPKSRSRRRPSGSRPNRPRPPLVPQPAPGLRGTVERASAPALVWLSARPKLVLPVLSVVLLVAGLTAPTVVGVPVLLLLAAVIGWLSYLSWPAVDTAPRVLRLVVVGMVLAAAAGRLGA